MQVINLSEKQAKRLLNECNSDFKSLVDLLQVRNGRIEIKDLDLILKYGLNVTSLKKGAVTTRELLH